MPARARQFIAETVVALVAAILIVAAAFATPAWFERHFLIEFFRPRRDQLVALAAVRVGLVAVAVALLVWARPRIGRAARARSFAATAAAALPVTMAAVLGLAAGELLLELTPFRARHQAPASREPLRRTDPVVGWVNVPNRIGRTRLGGRTIEYAFDAGGHRVRSPDQPVDYGAAAVLFAGESIMNGHGLTNDESIPAQVAARIGVAAANLAVGGYGTDQVYLRLKAELPRFREPRAVVVLFMPSLFHRNLERDRPHLGPGLTWHAGSESLRIVHILHRFAPYVTEAEVAEGLATTREQLIAIVDTSRAAGAIPLVLVPQLGPETPEERELRRATLDAARIPYLQVPVDPTWRVPGDAHPDARAARRLAEAVATYLLERGVGVATASARSPARPAPPNGGGV